MASTRQPVLHENLIEGVDTTLPAHLIGHKWRTQHNMRLTPALTQVPHKVLHSTVGTEDIMWTGIVPGLIPGTGKRILLGKTKCLDRAGTELATDLVDDGVFRRWAACLYNGDLFYTNELNKVRRNSGSTDVEISTAPSGRYLLPWYDHLVVGYPTYAGTVYPNRVMISHRDDLTVWAPDKINEADFYDFVEWGQVDYPWTGVTGLAKLNGIMWVYTPTAVIPMHYVGMPKVLQIQESSILTRVGNTFPWTLVALDRVHFFYDGIEKMFWAFDGQSVVAIGEPVRQFILDNLSTTPELASRMYGFVDIDNREVWWPFVSVDSDDEFDKAVVFNYRYKRWFTASVENVLSFCGASIGVTTIGEAIGTIAEQTVTIRNAGENTSSPRLFGTVTGKLLREETAADADGALLAADEPVLESGDFHYGDVRTVKENDLMLINATWSTVVSPNATITVSVRGREYLDSPVVWVADDEVGEWRQDLPDTQLGYPVKYGRVLRFRFEGSGVRGLKFSAYSDGTRTKQAEQ